MKIKKVVSSLAAVTMALSSFAALSVTAGAEEDIVTFGNEYTFDTVRLSYQTNKTTQVTVKVGEEEKTVDFNNNSTVYVHLDKDETASALTIDSGNEVTPKIELLDATKETLSLTSDGKQNDNMFPFVKELTVDGVESKYWVWNSTITNREPNMVDGEWEGKTITHLKNSTSIYYSQPSTEQGDTGTEANVYLCVDLKSVKNVADLITSLQTHYQPAKYVVSISSKEEDMDPTTFDWIDDESWIDIGTVDFTGQSGVPVKGNVNNNTSNEGNISSILTDNKIDAEARYIKIKMTKTIGDNSQNYMFNCGELGVFTYGDVLYYTDFTEEPTKLVELGKSVTFNHINGDGSFVYRSNGKWLVYTDGEEVTADAIGVSEGDSVPAFTLSWKGNLVKYVSEGKNAASIKTAKPKNDEKYEVLYDEKNAVNDTFFAFSADVNGTNNMTLDFAGAAAKVSSVNGYYGGGCLYPQYENVVGYNESNTEGIKLAAKRNTIKLNGDYIHKVGNGGDGTEHSSQYTDKLSFTESTVNKIVLNYIGSMRSICNTEWRGSGGEMSDIRIIELEIPGSVDLVSYNGTEVTVPTADGELTEVKEASATYGNEVNVTAEESSDKQKAVGYVVTLNPNGNFISELGVQATGVDTNSVKKRLSSSATFGGITGDSEFVFGFAASGVDSLSNIVVTADGEAVSTTAE